MDDLISDSTLPVKALVTLLQFVNGRRETLVQRRVVIITIFHPACNLLVLLSLSR
jgi:hypothetical protein